jgi:hypothetical protein
VFGEGRGHGLQRKACNNNSYVIIKGFLVDYSYSALRIGSRHDFVTAWRANGLPIREHRILAAE